MLRPTVTQGGGEGNVKETQNPYIGEEIDEESRASLLTRIRMTRLNIYN